MKILFFIESLWSGGKERRLIELMKGLSKNYDYKIAVAVTKPEILYDIKFLKKDQVYVIKREHKKDFSVFVKFYQLAKKFKPDIVNVWGNMVAFYAIPTKLLLGIPMVNNQITNTLTSGSYPTGLFHHRITFWFSDSIIANSYAGLKSYSATSTKSRVIYNGFDLFRLRDLKSKELMIKELNIKTKYVVAMVANFSIKKDYKTFGCSINNVLKQKLDVTFLTVGSGNYTDFREQILPSNMPNVKILGSRNDVESIMNICNIGVLLTDIRYKEGISNAILEFNALGVPVIATEGGGSNEIINNNETGYLISPESPLELSEKIIDLIENDVKREKFGIMSQKRIEKKFNIENMINGFTEEFEKIYLM